MQQIICRHVQSINPTYLLFCCYFFLNAYEFKIGKEKKQSGRIEYELALGNYYGLPDNLCSVLILQNIKRFLHTNFIFTIKVNYQQLKNVYTFSNVLKQ